jgi:methionyl-tRNA formyltransferase
MQMDQGLDTGATFAMRSIPIAADDSTKSLHDKLAKLGGEMIVEVVRQLSGGEMVANPQPQQGVCYASKISKEEAYLDFNLPAKLLERKIRALNPAPVAHALIDGVAFKLWRAELVERPAHAKIGQFFIQDHQLLIACGEGALRIVELQKPGGKRLPVAEFLKGSTTIIEKRE